MIRKIIFACSLFFAVFTLQAGEVVDINTADADTIAREVKGIGPNKAKAIIKYRNENGQFISVDELANVKGIGEKTVEKIRPYVTVSSSGTIAQ